MNRLIQVFRTGKHTDSAGVTREFTAADLRSIADNFDPKVGSAPIVKGHPAIDDPAFGWISRFMFEETSGVLYAVPSEVDPSFKAAVRAGQYRNVSMALFLPDHPSNPKPGFWYPRHIGFLGAASPAVSGLKAANFNDNGGGYLMFDPDNEAQASKFSAMVATAVASSLKAIGFKPKDDGNHGGNPSDPKKSPEYVALQEKADADAAALKASQDKAKKAAATQARTSCAAFTEKLTTEGKLTPAEAPGVTEILFSLSDDEGARVEFTVGEGDKANKVKSTPRKILSDFLTALPKRVEFSELSDDEGDLATAVNFTAPEGTKVNSAQLEKHNRIAVYAAKNGIDYIDAISIIEQGA